MGRCTRKCSKSCEVAVMEVVQAGVMSKSCSGVRDRDMSAEEAVENSGSVKRRKVSNGELRLWSSESVRVTGCDTGDVITTSENFGDLAEEDLSDPCSFSCGDVQASCCSSSGSINEKLKSADLEERAETETNATHILDRRDQSTPTSEFKEKSEELESLTTESDELESLTTPKSSVLVESRRTIPVEKMPPAAELEEFFAAAEKDLHKRFKDKYNFDVVKQVPLEGRFEWVELKQ